MTTSDHQTYQLRVAGHLDDRWSAWFGDLAIARDDDGTCTLTGTVADQAQLHGILARLRDLGATLLSLRTLDGDDEPGADASTRIDDGPSHGEPHRGAQRRLSARSAGPARGRGGRRPGGC